MALITPNTNIILIKLPIELDAENQLTFANATEQYNYFSSISGNLVLDNATYVRKDGKLRFNECFDDIINYNYCMYQNESYGNKWFYAFITDIQYLSNESSSVSLKTDVFQTWQFDIDYMTSFVEREHVSNDTVGLHTIPEGLETGEFISNAHIIDDAMDDITNDLIYVISSTVDLKKIIGHADDFDVDNPVPPCTTRMYNGIISGTTYFIGDPETIDVYLTVLARCGQIDAINGIFMIPVQLVGGSSESYDGFSVAESDSTFTYTNAITKQTTIDGYTPKNKKLLTGEFNYLLVSNNQGASYVMNYEDFSDSNCNFKIDMSVTPGCSIRMIPVNYKGNSEADEYGINMGKLPICSYAVDMYTNWLTQNSVNISGITVNTQSLNALGSMISGVGGFLKGYSESDVFGATSSYVSGISGIANSLVAMRQHELIPMQTRGNLNCGDVITSSNKNTFHFYKMSIKREYAEIIDEYFNAYGYKINKFKVPNINTRRNWNYIKTIGCNIHAYAPNSDVDEIKQMFNRGITLWHHANTFLDYSQPNNLV